MEEQKHSIEDLYRDAGKDLADKILGCIKEKAAIPWFYTAKVPLLEDKIPYELCKQGKHEEVEMVIEALMGGVYL